VSIIAPTTADAAAWADRVCSHLEKHTRSITRLNVEGDAGLTERLKEARAHGAHRIVAVGGEQFVRWAAQAMVGSLMPLAPVLIPGSQPIFGHRPLPATGWEKYVEALLSNKFVKVDMAMGTVNPFVHQLLAGFPAKNGSVKISPWMALFENTQLKLKVQIDRATVEGEFWCLAVANADLPEGKIRWLPGSNWADQRLDLLLVRPRSAWQRWKFLQALKRGEHGAMPGVLRYRGYRITVHAEEPWRYSADGSQTREAASPLVVEARPQMLRLVVPDGG
jgi:diacylglycerol kinase family enzyme